MSDINDATGEKEKLLNYRELRGGDTALASIALSMILVQEYLEKLVNEINLLRGAIEEKES